METTASIWVPIAISAGALVVSVVVLVLGVIWRGSDKKERRRLQDQVSKQGARAKVQKLVTTWQNSILSGQYAVRDDNWRGLLDRATEWRTSLADELEDLLKHSSGRRSRAYELLQATVDPAMRFETTVRPIVRRWEPPPPGKDPYDDKQEIEKAIGELQIEFNKVFKQLVALDDNQLVEPSAHTGAQ